MAKRIYHEKHAGLFQFKDGGTFYIRDSSGKDVSLKTTEIKKALLNKEFHEAISGLYGPAAFNKIIGATFQIYLDEMWGKVKRGERRESYVKSIEHQWTRALKPFWAHKRLVDIHQSNWDEFCTITMRKTDISDFQNPRSAFSNFMNWAHRKRFMLAVPTLENPVHRRRKRKIIDPNHLRIIFQNSPAVTDKDLQRLLSKPKKNAFSRKKTWVRYPGSLRLFLGIALFSGMRRGEIMKMEWSRVNLERRCLLLEDRHVKTNEGREIPINDIVVGLLTERAQVLSSIGIKTKYVFPNAKEPGRHADISGLKTGWKSAIERSGLSSFGYQWHDFRATFEKHMHSTKSFTDTQMEKMAGSSVEIQKRIYVSMTADDLRGLEDVVQVPGLMEVLKK